jgi:hypothetical protein
MSSEMAAGASPSATRRAVVEKRACNAKLPAITPASVASQRVPTSHDRDTRFNIMAALLRADRVE